MNDTFLVSAIDKLTHDDRDQDAWEILYRCVYPFLISSFLRSTRGNRYLAEEGVQEVMIRLLTNLRFNDRSVTPASLVYYMKQTMKSVMSDLLRASRIEPARLHDASIAFEAEYVIDPDPSPEQRAVLASSVNSALSTLPSRDQMIASMLLEGRTVGEIAARLSVSNKTAYNLVSLVRGHMRSVLFRGESRVSGKTPR